MSVKIVPDGLRFDEDIMWEAVKQNGLALKYLCDPPTFLHDGASNNEKIVREAVNGRVH